MLFNLGIANQRRKFANYRTTCLSCRDFDLHFFLDRAIRRHRRHTTKITITTIQAVFHGSWSPEHVDIAPKNQRALIYDLLIAVSQYHNMFYLQLSPSKSNTNDHSYSKGLRTKVEKLFCKTIPVISDTGVSIIHLRARQFGRQKTVNSTVI